MVYVDKPAWPFRGVVYGHMVADTLNELVEFAQKLGLSSLQVPPKSRYPHFDLSPTKHQSALSMGAVLVDRAKLIQAAKLLQHEFWLDRHHRFGKSTAYRVYAESFARIHGCELKPVDGQPGVFEVIGDNRLAVVRGLRQRGVGVAPRVR